MTMLPATIRFPQAKRRSVQIRLPLRLPATDTTDTEGSLPTAMGTGLKIVPTSALTTEVMNTLSYISILEALRYKPEGRGFDSRWCHWNFSLT